MRGRIGGEPGVDDGAIAYHRAGTQPGIVGQRPRDALARHGADGRKRGLRKRECGRPCDQRRHVGHGVVHDTAFDVRRIGQLGHPRCLGDAAVVDPDVDDHRTRPHRRHHRARNQLRRHRSGFEHAADHEIGCRNCVGESPVGRIREAEHRDRMTFGRQRRGERVAPRGTAGKDRDAGAHARGDARRFAADIAGADDHHAGTRNVVDTRQQDAGASAIGRERLRAHERREAARDPRHRREQRQTARRVAHGLVRDHLNPRGQDGGEQRRIAIELGKADDGGAGHQMAKLGRLQFLDLDDERARPHGVGRRRNRRAGRRVLGVGKSDRRTRAGFHDHRVPIAGELARALGRNADAALAVLAFAGNADPHPRPRTATVIVTSPENEIDAHEPARRRHRRTAAWPVVRGDRRAQTLERRSHEMTVEQDHQQPQADHHVHVDAHRAHAAQQHDHDDTAADQNHDGRCHPCDKARERRGQQRQPLRRRQRLRRGTQCHVREEHPPDPYDNGKEMQPAGELHAELGKGLRLPIVAPGRRCPSLAPQPQYRLAPGIVGLRPRFLSDQLFH